MLMKRPLKMPFLFFHSATRTNLHSISSWKGLQTSKLKKVGTSISLFFCKRNNFISNVYKHFTKVQNLDYFKGPFQPNTSASPWLRAQLNEIADLRCAEQETHFSTEKTETAYMNTLKERPMWSEEGSLHTYMCTFKSPHIHSAVLLQTKSATEWPYNFH